MKKPKFRVGDLVKSRRGNFHIVDCKHNPAVATLAIKVYTGGGTSTNPTTITEHWTYKLDDGKSWRYSEGVLESLIACPNCKTIGWDWVKGCDECGLSPEDVEAGA
jgi:hypothetical protein